jgi:hypothetical protein
VRGFRSALDGSVQPLRITVPDNYDGARPVPLDVAMNGRFTRLYEVETLNSWEGAEVDYLPGTLQIDLFGRGKNTYHWPGAADVFEAIAFAKTACKVDAAASRALIPARSRPDRNRAPADSPYKQPPASSLEIRKAP